MSLVGDENKYQLLTNINPLNSYLARSAPLRSAQIGFGGFEGVEFSSSMGPFEGMQIYMDDGTRFVAGLAATPYIIHYESTFDRAFWHDQAFPIINAAEKFYFSYKVSERSGAERASLEEDENTRNESPEIAADGHIHTKLTRSIRCLARLARSSCFTKNAPRFARRRKLKQQEATEFRLLAPRSAA